jgi:uncharacterized protein (TIGR03086 family)
VASPQEWAPAPLDGAGLLERAVGYARACLQPATRADLLAPTPCAGWDLLALLRHMDDSLAAFTDAAEIGYVDLAPAPQAGRIEIAAAIVARLRARACALLAAWSAQPGRRTVAVADQELRSDLLAAAGALEIAVHGWDVAVACGRQRPLPTGLALDLLPVVPLLVADVDRPRRFGPRVAVLPYSDPGTRLLAALGRRSGR